MENIAVSLTGGSGDNTIIAAVPGKRWAVYYSLLSTGASDSTYTWKETGATLSGAVNIPANTVHELEAKGEILIAASAVNKALIINCGAGALTGWLRYGYLII